MELTDWDPVAEITPELKRIAARLLRLARRIVSRVNLDNFSLVLFGLCAFTTGALLTALGAGISVRAWVVAPVLILFALAVLAALAWKSRPLPQPAQANP